MPSSLAGLMMSIRGAGARVCGRGGGEADGQQGHQAECGGHADLPDQDGPGTGHYQVRTLDNGPLTLHCASGLQSSVCRVTSGAWSPLWVLNENHSTSQHFRLICISYGGHAGSSRVELASSSSAPPSACATSWRGT